jgi:hypothetical protein
MANKENFISEGIKVYLDLTVRNDISAGDMVIINSNRGVGANTSTVTSLTGMTSSQYFIGVADEFVSGGSRGLTISTEGIFEFVLDSDTAATGYIGDPCIAVGAQKVALGYLHANSTGLLTMGNLVRLPGQGAASAYTAQTVWVRINPPMLHNWIYGGNPTATNANSATQLDIYPSVAATGIIFTGAV